MCSKCNTLQSRSSVVESIRDSLKFMYCRRCGRQLLIPELEDTAGTGTEEGHRLEIEQSMSRLRTAFQEALVVVKRLVSGKPRPSCFISYAWGELRHERWVRASERPRELRCVRRHRSKHDEAW